MARKVVQDQVNTMFVVPQIRSLIYSGLHLLRQSRNQVRDNLNLYKYFFSMYCQMRLKKEDADQLT